jgi:hypothetical protein
MSTSWAVGVSCTIELWFTPTDAGPATGEFRLLSASGNFSLPLTGEGLILANGSFEIDSATPLLLPDSWKGGNLKLGTGRDGRDCTIASEGACSMRFVGDGNGSKIQQDQAISGDAGDVFTLTFDSRADLVAGSGAYRVKLYIYYTDGTKKAFKLDLSTGTYDWTARTLMATATKEYYKIRVQIQYTRSRGMVWFDNVLLSID